MRKLIVRAMLVLAVGALVVTAGCSDDDPVSASNKAPVITSVTVNPASVIVGGTVIVTVVATDADGDALAYAYTPNGGAVSGSGATVTWIAPGAAGTYSISVTVSDGNEGEDTASGTLIVNAQTTTVQGTVALVPGIPGSLGNGVVSIYASLDDWNNYRPAMTVTVLGIGSSVTYSITNVPAGAWYMDFWLDSDFSQFWTSGDFVAWYGSGTWGAPTLTPFTIVNAEVKTIDMTAVLIP